ncbi:MAG: TIGR04282 family arsenosugar biosynthesis glycosyltransferase [Gemmatimonadetes bacterium]|nr:TIGR04282 family arsenosugar biosynthesis glycosyltransferase [Gemmatimonadota bacterium]
MTSLIVFVKNPIPGAVKTRLQTRYAPDQVAALYTAFVRDVLERAESIDVDRRVIAFDPSDARSEVCALFGGGMKALWEFVPQVQDDLGVRMREALVQELDAGASAAVLIGTDIPSLPASHITQAFDLLRAKDVVLGPSIDGGYYLVGVSKSTPEIFEDVEWSTPGVLAQTIDRVQCAGHTLGLVPPWFDVDTPDELDLLLAHARATILATGIDPLPHTHVCLSNLT